MDGDSISKLAGLALYSSLYSLQFHVLILGCDKWTKGNVLVIFSNGKHFIDHLGPILQDPSRFDLVETFAVKAEVTRMFREGNFRAAKLDLLYMKPESGHDNPMDLTTDAGFVNLVRSYSQYPFVVKIWQLLNLFLLP